MSRLAFVTTMGGFPWGGSEVLWSQAAELASKRGHAVLAVAFDWSRSNAVLTRLERGGATVIFRARQPSRSLLARAGRKSAPRLLERFENAWMNRVIEFSPSALCVSQGSVWELLGDDEVMRLADRLRCRVVHLCQLSNDTVAVSDPGRAALGRLFGRAFRTLFVAEANRAMTERQLGRRLPNAAIVRNPVNLSSFDVAGARPTGSVPVFASVASLTVRHKAQDILLECLSASSWRDREWQCRFYGSGADREYLERLTEHYGLSERVQFMGHADDIRALWEECDLLVMPSRMEGTPLALVEAMICGRPAVVSDVGGMGEWVTEPGCGYLAEAPTARSFGAALERAWQSRNDWARVGAAARQRALELIDPNPAESLLDILLDSEDPAEPD